MRHFLKQLVTNKYVSHSIVSTLKYLGVVSTSQNGTIELRIEQPKKSNGIYQREETKEDSEAVFVQASVTAQAEHGGEPQRAEVPGVPRNIRVRHPLEDLFSDSIEQPVTAEAYIARLMTAADRFSCTTEMATFLAIMSIGGPRRLLYTDPSWDVATRRAVHRIHTALEKSCVDDLDFALKLYSAWSEPSYNSQPLAPAWALRQVWHPRRIPAFSTAMREALGTQVAQFGKAVTQALTYAQIRQLVAHYNLTEVAENWLLEVGPALLQAQQESWARAFFIHHELFRKKIEPERERLLGELELHKREEERRSIHFDLLDKVRIIFTYCFSPEVSVPYAIKTRSEWGQWLEQSERSAMAVARFIAQQTREYNGDLLPTLTYERLFLDQRVRLGSRYSCSVTEQTPTGLIHVRLAQRLSDAPLVQESFSGEYTAATHSHADSQSDVMVQESAQTRVLADAWPYTIFGSMQDVNLSLQVGDTLDIEVIGYTFDTPSFPKVIVRPVPTVDPFDAFMDRYQIGDVFPVIVQAYDERPGDPLISLIVREPVSQLEILLEPEQLSFTPLGQAAKAIPLETELQVTLDDIDEEKRSVSLSLLPFMEVHLNKMLQASKQEDGTYLVEAKIRAVTADQLLLILDWSEPKRGFIYAAHIPLDTLAEQERTYQVGEIALLQLAFQDQPSRSPLRRLPTEIAQMIDLQQGLQRLFWEHHYLFFHGRMSYGKYSKFLALSTNRAYQRALHNLYRSSHQLLTEVVGVREASEPEEEATNPSLVEEIARSMDHIVTFEVETRSPALVEEEIGTSVEEEIYTSAEREQPAQEEEIIIDSDYIDNEVTQKLEAVGTTIPLVGGPPIAKYRVDQRVYGRVTGVKDFGAFIEIEPGVSGLVHKSKMWGYIADVRDVIHLDDMVEVIILAINLERGNMELSMQIPEQNPLLHYQVDDLITGVVTDVQEFGAFVDIEPGVSGLVHKSKMWGYVPDAREVIQVGEEVTVRVLSTDLEKGGLELSMQVPEHDPLVEYNAGDIVTGIVTDVQNFGAFVEVEPGVSGLVYRTDIREGVTDARRELQVGDEVDVLIIRIDMEKRRLSFSMRDI